MEFRILGPLEVREGDQLVLCPGAKQRLLLGVLLLHANRVVSSDRLIDALWGENPPASAHKSLQMHVSHLRKLLEPERSPGASGRILMTRPPGYELRVETGQLDLMRFERLLDEARHARASGEPGRAGAMLRDALALWRGPPFAEFTYASFARAEIDRLEELRIGAVAERIEADLALGRHADIVAEVEALTDQHPLHERLRGQLMLALYRSGRQAEALEVYRQIRWLLVEELGIEPGRELRELEQAILTHDASLEPPPTAEPAAKPSPDPGRGVFVGRAPELAELQSGLQSTLAGHGRLYLLGGGPGIGKSRLAEELAIQARDGGAYVLVGRCWEAGGAPAYWPWVQSLRAYVRDSDAHTLRSELGTGAAALAQILPELREHFPDLPAPSSFDSEEARFELFDATAAFLRNASRRRPMVLLLEDLQGADAPSLLLLRFLARELDSLRILVVGTYREVDPVPGQPLTEMLAEVTREPVTRRLSLDGLSESEVAEYVELTAAELGSAQLLAKLHEKTEGNPLFVGEIVRLLSVEGRHAERDTEVGIAIPQSVRDVISRRLSHLSDECNRILVLASVIGREFALVALARLASSSEDRLLETLDEAMSARVLSDVPGAQGRLRFAHVLMRDIVYEGLTTARRVQMHRLAIEALESLYGAEPGPHLAELAHHSIAGRDFAKALRYAWGAADWALGLLAYEEAARLYRTALDALNLADPQDDKACCELLLSLGDAEARAGNPVSAKTAFMDAAGIARHGHPRELARAAIGYGGWFVWERAGGDRLLVPLLEEGLNALPEGEVELRARLLARLAGALRDEPTRDRRDRLSREAVDLARQADNPAVLAWAIDGRIVAIIAPDTIAECLTLGSELGDLAERLPDADRVAHGHWALSLARLTVGEANDLEAGLEVMSRLASKLRSPAQLWGVYAAQAMFALATGRLAAAEELIGRAFTLGERAQQAVAISANRLQRYTLWDFVGGLEHVAAEIDALVADYPTRPMFRCALAHLHARLGRLAEARRILDDLGAADDFSALPFDHEWLFGMSLLADTSALLGDADSAAVLYGLLLPWKAFNVVDYPEGIRGSVARYLGILATTTQRWKEAKLHFEEAIAMNKKMGARPWVAHTQRDYAEMLLAKNEPGDRERAVNMIEQALVTYQQLGMETWAHKTQALAPAP